MVRIVPELFVRFVVWMLVHARFRVRVAGHPNVPRRGPVLLVSNRLSLDDGLLIRWSAGRFVRFLVPDSSHEASPSRRLSTRLEAIFIAPGSVNTAALDQARRDLAQGHIVCVVAEPTASRGGEAGSAAAAFGRMADSLGAPLVPAYLDSPWRGAFRPAARFWGRPIRISAAVAFGRALAATTDAAEVRHALQLLGYELAMQRPAVESLGRRFVSTARREWRSFSMADATTEPMTFGRSLVAALLLSRWIRRRLPDEPAIGLLLPASVGGALANLAVTLAGRVPVNLNFGGARVDGGRCGAV
jgi:acyl-[acyl-carrier-protein]-phospholipid O-acyltransferase/long-chain-fatty-acid--[acyl-carrier-protein] ligase